uniref:Uncharacterized protein n=1 Tax=Arundo donax TaxID=35708 RepID=A0A0A9EV92_ARUDO
MKISHCMLDIRSLRLYTTSTSVYKQIKCRFPLIILFIRGS